MSRIGKLPVSIPDDVKVSVEANTIHVSGKLGELSVNFTNDVNVKYDEQSKNVQVASADNVRNSAKWGLFRSLIYNAVKGVSEGFKKELEITGVGYRSSLIDGKNLFLNVGNSHPWIIPIPNDLTAKCETPTLITITGIDNQKVGQFAAHICSIRKTEPYKGKGINLKGVKIKRKANKKK